jgi:hypothetical protein
LPNYSQNNTKVEQYKVVPIYFWEVENSQRSDHINILIGFYVPNER